MRELPGEMLETTLLTNQITESADPVYLFGNTQKSLVPHFLPEPNDHPFPAPMEQCGEHFLAIMLSCQSPLKPILSSRVCLWKVLGLKVLFQILRMKYYTAII